MNRSPRELAHRWFRRPIVEFFETEASGGIILILATAVALLWANSPWRGAYHDLWHIHAGVSFGSRGLDLSLHHWINDGLMAVFFFYVGLEIKRELLTGELASWQKAALPAMGALGGMLVPAGLYALLNRSGDGAAGWGIPMATDIAFAIGILMLLGKRIPLGLKVFLTALAVVDDLGAVLVIAVFYTAQLSGWHLLAGVGVLALMAVAGRLGMRRRLFFAAAGIVVWYFFLRSGIHATVAGVLAALTVPHAVAKGRREFVDRMDEVTDGILEREERGAPITDEEHEVALETVHDLAEKAGSPLQHLEHQLAPWVAYGVMPVFALANAGLAIDAGALGRGLADAVPQGILLGLVAGKQVGIFAFSWLAVRLGWARLPAGVSWRSLHGAAVLGGIGFTMSLFIANLAFGAGALLEEAKMGILLASAVSALAGAALLLGAPGSRPAEVATGEP
jgi:NhaA family Na+:H+ antiporter